MCTQLHKLVSLFLQNFLFFLTWCHILPEHSIRAELNSRCFTVSYSSVMVCLEQQRASKLWGHCIPTRPGQGVWGYVTNIKYIHKGKSCSIILMRKTALLTFLGVFILPFLPSLWLVKSDQISEENTEFNSRLLFAVTPCKSNSFLSNIYFGICNCM